MKKVFKGFGEPKQRSTQEMAQGTEQETAQLITESSLIYYDYLKEQFKGEQDIMKLLAECVMKFATHDDFKSREDRIEMGRVCVAYALRSMAYEMKSELKKRDIDIAEALNFIKVTPVDEMVQLGLV